MSSYAKSLRRRLHSSRILGFFSAAVGITGVLFYYFEIVNPWLAIIVISYAIASCFSSNVTYQDIKVGSPWEKVNAALSVVFFMATIAIMIFGYVSGAIKI